jgi:hypothetical protein
LEFLFSFEEVIFEDYENTSNYFSIKRPPVLVTSSEALKESTVIKGDGQSRDVELSPDAFRISSPSSTIQCQIQGTVVNALYNPVVGVNIMANFVALTFLGNET